MPSQFNSCDRRDPAWHCRWAIGQLLSLASMLGAMTLTGCAPSAAPPAADRPAESANKSDVGDEDPVSSSSAEGKSEWREKFDEMNRALDLSPEEKAKLEQVIADGANSMEEFWATTGQQLSQFEAQLKTAIKQRSLSKIRELTAKAEPLRRTFRELIESQEQSLRNALTEENQARWLGHQLATRFLDLTQSIDFDEEQVVKIKQTAVESARSVADQLNPAAAGFLTMEEKIQKSVLTPDQQKAYDKIKNKNKLRALFK